MSDLTGSYVHIRLTVDDSNTPHQLLIDYSSVAWMIDETSPTISTYEDANITLPQTPGRPFAFCIGYDGGTSTGYIWDGNPLNCVAIATAPAQPVFGVDLPDGFIALKQNGGLMTFIDSNRGAGMQYEYSIQLIADPNGKHAGSPPLILDPKIRNS